MRLLTKKTFVTATNNWYAPTCEFHEKYPSILRMVIVDKTSSAGDWGGFLIQRTGHKRAQCIAFQQENNYPRDGFTLYTSDFAFFAGDPNKPDFVERAASCYTSLGQV